MTRWKKDAKEFEVTVNFEEKRGYQSYIPKPIMLLLGNPNSLKYMVRGKRIEISAGTQMTKVDNPEQMTTVNTPEK